MGLRSAFHPRRFSVRGLTAASITGVGALMLAIVAALVVTSSVLQATSTHIVRSTRSVALAEEIELHLLAHERFANVALATGDPAATAARVRAHNEAQRLLKRAKTYAKSTEEVQLLDKATRDVETYFEGRRALESRNLAVSGIVRRGHHQLDDALASVRALQKLHRQAVATAHARAQRAAFIFKIAAISAGALVLIALLVIAVGVRRYLLGPIVRLRRAIEEFRENRREPEAVEPAPRELAEIAEAFNDMSTTMIRQRKGQLAFLAGVAHDLRNPLSAIKTGVQILERKTNDSSQTTAILNRQIDHLDRMVGDLMEASRIEAGQLDLHLAEIDLREPAREIAELYRSVDSAREVTVTLPDAPVPVRVDRLRIEQVIGNLVQNALKYSADDKPVTVAISMREREAELSVSDRGIGIPADQLEEIFLPFQRRASGPGAGLGLSVARGIVLAHDGAIEVDSEPGVGSTFRVRLPLARESERKAERSSEPKSPGDPGEEPGGAKD